MVYRVADKSAFMLLGQIELGWPVARGRWTTFVQAQVDFVNKGTSQPTEHQQPSPFEKFVMDNVCLTINGLAQPGVNVDRGVTYLDKPGYNLV